MGECSSLKLVMNASYFLLLEDKAKAGRAQDCRLAMKSSRGFVRFAKAISVF